ncbi:putative erythrocyte membrane protein [Roseibium sp. TrichSKD4]|nr:putative erythrocyte membrane protein [Roseibium sp. TrichSKD4]
MTLELTKSRPVSWLAAQRGTCPFPAFLKSQWASQVAHRQQLRGQLRNCKDSPHAPNSRFFSGTTRTEKP